MLHWAWAITEEGFDLNKAELFHACVFTEMSCCRSVTKTILKPDTIPSILEELYCFCSEGGSTMFCRCLPFVCSSLVSQSVLSKQSCQLIMDSQLVFFWFVFYKETKIFLLQVDSLIEVYSLCREDILSHVCLLNAQQRSWIIPRFTLHESLYINELCRSRIQQINFH